MFIVGETLPQAARTAAIVHPHNRRLIGKVVPSYHGELYGCLVAVRASNVFNLVAFAIGTCALAIVLDRLGWAGLERAIIGTGRWFVVIAVIDLASIGCD